MFVCLHVVALEFSPPHLPLSLQVYKNISPYLKSSYSINIPNLHHLTFLASSVAIDDFIGTGAAAPSSVQRNAQVEFWNDVESISDSVSRLGRWPDTKRPDQNAPLQRQYLICGRIFSDNHLETIWTSRLSQNCISYISATSDLRNRTNPVNLYAKLHREHSKSCSELTYSSQRSLLGLRYLRHFKLPTASVISVGGEVYYTASEKSGGLSLAARVRTRHVETELPDELDDTGVSDVNVIVNPVMGHLSAVYATATSPNLLLSTRYDFNVYSLDSDLAVGLVYAPKDKDQVLKLRIGSQQVYLSY